MVGPLRGSFWSISIPLSSWQLLNACHKVTSHFKTLQSVLCQLRGALSIS